ncbi:Mur ligase domain-containing protein, partial [uncultured Holdemania sp.]|uniref:Mur ligase domain-containing protein n=1 Tax=uncultured Holdemania sp. TaxID=527664 RepID=UPI0025D926C4
MKLSALFDNAPDIEIENLMVDSRDVLPNSIFFCIKGMIHDGHRYVNAAVKNGAVCVVHSEDIKRNNANVVYIKVRDVIAALNQVAACFYGYPSKKMVVYGVTGTNGKSSIACMIRNLLDP